MILVLGGTTEARQIGMLLQDAGLGVIVTTVTDYGKQLAGKTGIDRLYAKELGTKQLTELVQRESIEKLVDATHPYACRISENAMNVCIRTGVPYCRYERPATDLPEHPLLIKAGDYHQAAEILPSLGKRIFFTIGSRNLPFFCQDPRLQKMHMIARVLPEVESIKVCRDTGLSPSQIAALQGPFSKEANRWMFSHFKSEAVVSKESGAAGGVLAKWHACLELNMPLLVISRPQLDYPNLVSTPGEVLSFCR